MKQIIPLLLALLAGSAWAVPPIVIKYNDAGTLVTKRTLDSGVAPAPVSGTPVTSMRPSWWYIDNSKFPPRNPYGIDYVDEFVDPWNGTSGLSGWPGVTSPTPTAPGFVRQPAVASYPTCVSGPRYCYEATEYVGTGSQAGYTLTARNSGNFRTFCDFSHFAYDDPLVYPGQPGKSHLHAFFGNTQTGGNTTSNDIANKGKSTCSGGINNRTGYWVPAMIYHCPLGGLPTGCNAAMDGKPIVPSFMNVYYKGSRGGGTVGDPFDGRDFGWYHEEIQPFPVGLRMIAGDPAGNPTTPSGAVSYVCRNAGDLNTGGNGGAIPGTGVTPAVAACGSDATKFVMAIGFMSCWNGVDLDSPGHQAHMADPPYGGLCPSGYVSLPGIAELVEFELDAPGSPAGVTGHAVGDIKFWRLSSDRYADTSPAGYSGHADWMMGWKPSIMQLIVERCLRPGLDCHNDFLGPKTNSDDTVDLSGAGPPFNGYRTMRQPYRFRQTH